MAEETYSRLIVDLESVVGVAATLLSHEVQIVEVEIWVSVEAVSNTEVKRSPWYGMYQVLGTLVVVS